MTWRRALTGCCALALVGACVSTSAQLAPGRSSRDETLFATPPAVVHDDAHYKLSWTYGTDGFYFSPAYEVRDGKLIFAVSATTSTGSRTGKRGEVSIVDPMAIHALRAQGAWWLEPDGSLTKLDVIDAPSARDEPTR
ncbi:MAG: hypothetical protein HYS27_04970 [Deltaproteobacteria bacterium]|nr:hypothetical protein [Deltaproteobacteria bacterium]